jgi:large subunit ribosomal protein L24
VMLLDPKSGKPSRVKARIDEDGTKERLAVKSGEAIPRTR